MDTFNHMQTLPDTQAIFHQLSELEPCGVKSIIENHSSADHARELSSALTIALRLRLSHLPVRDARIEAQRKALLPLLTSLRRPFASAG